MKLDTKDYEAKMKKSVSAYGENLSTIRAGRANPDVLKKISVDYYGSPTPIASIAEIKVTDARTIVITAWDKSAMKGIEKAILTSDLGINPQNDGSAIRLSFPPTTEERRRELAKQISKQCLASEILSVGCGLYTREHHLAASALCKMRDLTKHLAGLF